MERYAGQQLLDLLNLGAEAVAAGDRAYEKHEISEKDAPDELSSYNSFISYSQSVSSAGYDDVLASLPEHADVAKKFFAGQHLLDLLKNAAKRADITNNEKNEINELNEESDSPHKLLSFNSYPEAAHTTDRESGLASLPAEIFQGLSHLMIMQPPGDYSPARWSKAAHHAIRFASDWALIALRLGWPLEELFGLHKVAPDARYDFKGLAFVLSNDKYVVGITESSAAIRTAGGASLTYYRRSDQASATLAWELDGEAPTAEWRK